MALRFGVSCYWRFRGKGGPYRYGWPTQISHNLVRMGLWNGDTIGGFVVNINEIEIQ